MKSTKLVILRGPSGSGKTTTAKRLFDNAKVRTVLIEQDYYRFIFNPPGGGTKPNSDAIHEMIKNDVLIALKHGYNVILEGILSVVAYGNILEEIFAIHPEENYIFYFDISFDETVKRHKKRQAEALDKVHGRALVQDIKRHERLLDFGEEDMQEWYPASHRSNHKLERIVSQSLNQDEVFNMIISEAGL